jgi:Zn finger protein HypA/HybF involved in hydrogenase expression
LKALRFGSFLCFCKLFSMKFILVQTYNNYIDANIVMGRLEEEGINCWLQDENTVTITPMFTNAIGGIKLMVAEPHLQRATELLRQFSKAQKEQTPCPKCGSTNVEFVSTPRKASNWIGAIFGFLFGDYALAVDKVYHCFNCGNEFEQPKTDENPVNS